MIIGNTWSRCLAFAAALCIVSCADDTQPTCSVDILNLGVTGALMPPPERGCLEAVPCSDGEYVDADPNASGTQHNCSVSDVQRYGQPDQAEQVLPMCNANTSTTPCWRTLQDPSFCATGEHAAIEVIRSQPPPDENVVSIACRAECRYCSQP